MICKDCAARAEMLREAVFKAKLKEAVEHAVKGAAELVGVKPKTGESELVEKTTSKKRREQDAGVAGNNASDGTFNQE